MFFSQNPPTNLFGLRKYEKSEMERAEISEPRESAHSANRRMSCHRMAIPCEYLTPNILPGYVFHVLLI